MRFTEYLIEKRKYPNKNPKTAINDIIINAFNNSNNLKAIGDKNSFVSFTEVDKLGINPRSRYNTPLGIYAYPASYIIDIVGKDYLMAELPFAGESQYVNIFEFKNGNIIDINNITEDKVNVYYKKIVNYYKKKKNIDKDKANNTIQEIIEDSKSKSYRNTPGGELWYVTMKVAYYLSNDSSDNTHITWNALFRNIGINAVYDSGEGIIHPNEPTQVVFFSKNSIGNIQRHYNKYSPEQIDTSKKYGDINRQANIDFNNDLKNLNKEEFIKKYESQLHRFISKRNIHELINKYPELTINTINEGITKYARTYDFYNRHWTEDLSMIIAKKYPKFLELLPPSKLSYKIVKIALENKLLENSNRRRFIRYGYIYTNSEKENDLIHRYIVNRFPNFLPYEDKAHNNNQNIKNNINKINVDDYE